MYYFEDVIRITHQTNLKKGNLSSTSPAGKYPFNIGGNIIPLNITHYLCRSVH